MKIFYEAIASKRAAHEATQQNQLQPHHRTDQAGVPAPINLFKDTKLGASQAFICVEFFIVSHLIMTEIRATNVD